MNIAIIIAGGSGSRMGQNIPKQFINVYDKPVIIYTLESFEKHPQIDAIEVVCIDGWHDVLLAYAKQFNISKLKWIVSGGKTGQESIRNGVYNLEKKCNENDNIIIHDGVRPLVDAEVLTDVISKCNTYGNAVSSMPYNEQIFIVDDEISTTKYIPRETLRRVVTPQAYKFKELLKCQGLLKLQGLLEFISLQLAPTNNLSLKFKQISRKALNFAIPTRLVIPTYLFLLTYFLLYQLVLSHTKLFSLVILSAAKYP